MWGGGTWVQGAKVVSEQIQYLLGLCVVERLLSAQFSSFGNALTMMYMYMECHNGPWKATCLHTQTFRWHGYWHNGKARGGQSRSLMESLECVQLWLFSAETSSKHLSLVKVVRLLPTCTGTCTCTFHCGALCT